MPNDQFRYFICKHLLSSLNPDDIGTHIPPGIMEGGMGQLCCKVEPSLHHSTDLYQMSIADIQDIGLLPKCHRMEVSWAKVECGKSFTTTYLTVQGNVMRQDTSVLVDKPVWSGNATANI